jgi:hypothetical protein
MAAKKWAALNACGISLRGVFERMGKYLDRRSMLSIFGKYPELIVLIVLVGAVVAVSLWEPSDPAQAVAKMALEDVLRFAWLGYMAFIAAEITVKGLKALARRARRNHKESSKKVR